MTSFQRFRSAVAYLLKKRPDKYVLIKEDAYDTITLILKENLYDSKNCALEIVESYTLVRFS